MSKIVKSEKRTIWDSQLLINCDNIEYKLYSLTEREISAILTGLTTADWSTRWIGDYLPDKQSFIDSLRYSLMTPIEFCSAFIDCIENDDAVKNSLLQFLRDNSMPTNGSGGSVLGNGDNGNLLANVPCDLDSIYGACVAIEDYIASVSKDLIESIVDEISDSLKFARAVDFVPLLGDLPVIDDLNDFITWITTNGVSAFDIGYSTGLRQENICDLFNLACQECILTPFDVVSMYGEKALLTLGLNTLWYQLIGQVIGSSNDEQFALSVMSLVAGALSAGGSILGLTGLYGLATIANTGTSSNDHLIFCDPCPPSGTWCFYMDFGSFDYSQYMNPNPVLNTNSTIFCGGKNVYYSAPYWYVVQNSLVITLPESRILTECEIHITVDSSAGSPDFQIGFSPNDPTVLPYTWNYVYQNDSHGEHIYTLALDDIETLNITISRCTASGNTRIHSIKLTGLGTNPFGGNNCL